jgi:hypothetical protein
MFKKIVTSNFTSIFFAVGFSFTAILGKTINNYFTYGFSLLLAGYILTYVIFLIIDLKKIFHWEKQMEHSIIYQSVHFEWQVNEKGDFFAKNIFSVTNIGKKSISVLPFDNAIWLTAPKSSKISFKLLNTGGKQFLISEYIKNNYQMILDILSGKKAKVFSWSNVIEPPLSPGETLRYQIKLESSASEKDAFSKNGTFAGIPANIPTKSASLKFAAPNGYRFKLLDPFILLDQKGTRIEDMAEKNKGPILSASGSFLDWQLNELQTGLRYWFKYTFVKDAG